MIVSVLLLSVFTYSYKPIIIKFNNELIELTPSLLMDYGVLYQLIFSHPDQTDGFGRKLTICVLNAFIRDFNNIMTLWEHKSTLSCLRFFIYHYHSNKFKLPNLKEQVDYKNYTYVFIIFLNILIL